MAERIRLSETLTCASGLHYSGCVKLECGHQPLTSLMSLKGAQVDSATETAGGGRDREKGEEGGREGCLLPWRKVLQAAADSLVL